MAEIITFQVTGYVRHRGGSAAEGVTVRLYDENLGDTKELMNSAIDEHGNFLFEFDYNAFNPEKELPDLFVKCFSTDEPNKELGQSEIRYGASNIEKFQIILGSKPENIWSEFAQIHSELYPLLPDVMSFSDLTETKVRKQISYLANHSSLKFSKVRAFVRSFKLEAETRKVIVEGQEQMIPAAFFYGLIRSGYPSSLQGVLMLDSDCIKQAIHESRKKLWIPWKFEVYLPTCFNRINEVRIHFILGKFKEPALIDKIIELEISDPEERREFYRIFFKIIYGDQSKLEFDSLQNSNGEEANFNDYMERDAQSLQEFWDEIADNQTFHSIVPKLKSTLRIAILVGGEFELVKALRAERDDANLLDFSFLVIKKMNDWQTVVDALDPAITEVDLSDEDKRINYAKSVFRSIEAELPNLLIRERLIDYLPVGETKNYLIAHKNASEELLIFIDNNAEERIALSTQIYQTEAIENFDNASKIKIVEKLEKCQRLYRLTQNFDAYIVLEQKGIQSSLDISNISIDRFLTDYEAELHDHISCRKLYNRAKEVSSIILHAYSYLSPIYANYSFNKVGEFKFSEEDNIDVNWQNLFDKKTLRFCEHWSSVISPSAYLVELLNFLKERKSINNTSCYDILMDRRPDLIDLEFSKENTLSTLPYIDLVLEILESLIYKFEFQLDSDALNFNPQDGEAVEQAIKDEFQNKIEFGLSQEAVFTSDGEHHNSWILNDKPAHFKVKRLDNVLKVYSRGLQFDLGVRLVVEDNETVSDPIKEVFSNHKEKILLSDDARYHLINNNEIYITDHGVRYKCILIGNSHKIIRRTFQSEKTDNRISLSKNFIPAAYSELKAASRPWALPFDLHLETIKDYLLQNNINLYEIENTFSEHPDFSLLKTIPATNSDTNSKAIIVNLLNLASFEELEQLLHPDVNQLFQLSGPINNSTQDLLISPLLKACDLNAAEFEDILLTKYVSNNGQCVIEDDGKKNFEDLSLNKFYTDDAKRLFTFTKLLKRTGYSLSELDHALHIFAENRNNNLLIAHYQKLATLAYLSKRTNLKIQDLLFCFYADDDAPDVVYEQFYYQLFPKETIQNTALELVDDQIAPGETVHNTLSYLQGAFNISESNLCELIELLNINVLSIKNISRIYQYTLLSDAFDLSVKDIYTLVELSQLTIFKQSDLKKTINFIKLLDIIERFSIDADKLKFLVLENSTNSAIISESSIKRFLNNIKKGIQEINKQTTTDDKKQLIDYFLVSQISAEFGLSEDLFHNDGQVHPFLCTAIAPLRSDDFINFFAVDDENSLGSIINQKAVYKKLRKLSILSEQFNLEINAQKYLLKQINGVSLFEFFIESGRQPHAMNQWIYFAEFNYILSKDRALLYIKEDIFDLLNKSNGTNYTDFTGSLSKLAGTSKTDLKSIGQDLLSEERTTLIQDCYLKSDALSRLFKCILFLNKMGSSYTKVKQFINDFSSNNIESNTADWARDLMRSKYGEDWSEALKPCHDKLKQKRRDALKNYLYESDPDLIDSNDFDEKYLIGVQMSSCTNTSRIVQAYIAIQRFINRCLLGKESEILVNKEIDSGWNDWYFLQQYRVWEAKRKIFLFPELYIDPNLLDGKSEIYIQAEERLQQNIINDKSAVMVYEEYFDKLFELSNLEVVSFYKQTDNHNNILHLFARTRGIPEKYFYRQCIENVKWTPWERVELDLTGEYFIPVYWNHRLYLFWPIFKEVNTAKADSDVSIVKWQIQLAWSYYRNGKWTPKKLTKENMLSYYGPEEGVIDRDHKKSMHLFRASFNNNELNINWAAYDLGSKIHVEYEKEYFWEKPGIKKKGCFHFTGVGDRCYTSTQGEIVLRRLTGTTHQNNYFISNKTDVAFLPTQSSPQSDGIIFKNVQQDVDYRIVADSQNLAFHSNSYFFFEDSQRSYYISPVSKIKKKSLQLEKVAHPLDFRNIDQVRFESFKTQYPSQSFLIDDSQNSAFPEVYQPVIIENQIKPDSQLAFLKSEILLEEDCELPFESKKKSPLSFDNDIKIVQKPFTFPTIQEEIKYRFKQFDLPFTQELMIELKQFQLKGLFKRKNQEKSLGDSYFKSHYNPSFKNVLLPYPKGDVDFNHSGTHSSYNWEALFFLPFSVALQLSANRNFEEARKWFLYMFDPNKSIEDEHDRTQYWITKPLRDASDSQVQLAHLKQLVKEMITGEQNDELKYKFKDWHQQPFNPHAIARLRNTVYPKAIVFQFIKSIISWADDLFRRDQREDIAKAAQLYNEASDILGPRPVKLNSLVKEIQTYTTISKNRNKTALMSSIEQLIGASDGNDKIEKVEEQDLLKSSMFYFDDVENEGLIDLFDLVADRLYKIHHCQNIDGQVRSLALFPPPIDPAMLVKAAAFGLSMSSILSSQYAPRPLYHFESMIQFARMICNNLKDLGSKLQAAIEKEDAEELANLKTSHLIEIQKDMKKIKQNQVKENNESLNGLKESLKIANFKYQHYKKLISKGLIKREDNQLDLMDSAQDWATAADTAQLISSILHIFPQAKASLPPAITFGGIHLGNAASAVAAGLRMRSSYQSYHATRNSIKAGHDRREQDWKLQRDLASKEIKQIEKQLAAADLRLKISEKDLESHNKQIEQSAIEYDLMKSKFSNKKLYGWLKNKLSSLYFNAYQLAFDVAKEAEAAFQFDLGEWDKTFIDYGSWSSLYKGLGAGDEISRQLDNMEAEFKRTNHRKNELNIQVSLAQTDPEALIRLCQSGECFFNLTEDLFDRNHFGLYQRRIKSISISFPCTKGPFTNINAKLSLLKDTIRINDDLLDNGDYVPKENNNDDDRDPRFKDNLGKVESLRTSTGQNDNGQFELNFKDERYLKFEGAGAISDWKLELPFETNDFDYDSLSDVIIQVYYTAKEGKQDFINKAKENLINSIQENLLRYISFKHEFPELWHKLLLKPDGQIHEIEFKIKDNLLHKLKKYSLDEINSITLFIPSNPGNIKCYLGPKEKMLANTWETDCKLDITQTDINELYSSQSIHKDLGAWVLRIKTPGANPKKIDWENILMIIDYNLKANP